MAITTKDLTVTPSILGDDYLYDAFTTNRNSSSIDYQQAIQQMDKMRYDAELQRRQVDAFYCRPEAYKVETSPSKPSQSKLLLLCEEL